MDKISETKPKPEGVGYKVFDLRYGDGELYGELARRDKIRPMGTWLKSRNYSVRKGDCLVDPIRGKYPVGWHVFKSMIAVKNWVCGMHPDYIAIKRIRYRQAHTEGTTDGYKTVVAKEIYIIPIANRVV
jgi:hypothetical protein